MHINKATTPWPTLGSGAYRLWDAGTGWALLNPSNGTYTWGPLDSWVTKAQTNNVDLLYTFGRTPQWASADPSNTTCLYSSGACGAPSDYAYWDKFVTAIATRYKGKIKYYEMWNEPNDKGFWQGTTAQLVEMTRRASAIIRSIDPDAEILSPAPTYYGTAPWTWMDGYLSAGGGQYVDYLSYHGYTGNNKADSIYSWIDNITNVANKYGVGNKPQIISEGGWGTNTVITDADAQAAFLVQRYMLITSRPQVKRFYWYQYDNTTWGTLWNSTSGVTKSGTAYAQLVKWLAGATANGCTKDGSSTYTCSYTMPNGTSALGVWNATASVSYTPGSEYTQKTTIYGVTSTINGGSSVTVGNSPVLFTSSAKKAPTATMSVTPTSGIAPVSVSATVNATVDPTLTVQSTSISFGDGTTVNSTSASHTYTSAGTYTVSATVTDSANKTVTSTATVTVTANQAPLAALSVTPANGKAPLAVSASSASSSDADGSIASSSIDFGDGTVVSGATASHTYTTAGTYTVKATVTDNLGAKSSATATVTAAANQAPVAKLSLTQSGATVTASTTGSSDPDGSIASTVINWGDGSSTSAASGSHTYAKSGTYTVTATVTDNDGASSSATQPATITINQPPVAKLSLTQSGATVTASTAGSSDPDGSIASTVINWGDGSSTSAASGSHTYANSGTYTVTATVTDNSGASASATQTATISINQPPVAKLSLTQSGATVTASTAGSSDPDGTIASTVINWGDGSSTSAASGSHTYAKTGTYTVTATVTDNSGASASATQTASISINQAPVASMTLTQTASVSFKVTSGSYDPDGTIASTVINWGDGGTSSATSASHTYTKPGTYTVTVTVKDNSGATASTSRTATASWGIFMVSPKSASTTASPVHFVGSAAAPYGIASTKIVVNGTTVYKGTSSTIDTNISMAAGTKNVVVQAVSNAGVLYQTSFSFTAN